MTRLARRTFPLVLLVGQSCDSTLLSFGSPDDPVAAVGIALGFPGYLSNAVLTVGDQDTIRAQAYTGEWPSYTKYDSNREARRFTYTSSDSSVASVTIDGVIHGLAPGVTILHASVDGITSPPMELGVSPPANSFIAEPDSVDAILAETIAISISAADANGQSVAGVIFDVSVDTTYWAVTTIPAEGTWKLKTPVVLHLTARLAGRVRLIATATNERASMRFAASVPISVAKP